MECNICGTDNNKSSCAHRNKSESFEQMLTRYNEVRDRHEDAIVIIKKEKEYFVYDSQAREVALLIGVCTHTKQNHIYVAFTELEAVIVSILKRGVKVAVI